MTTPFIRGPGGRTIVALCAFAAAGCAHNLATIHYSQPANAYVFDSDPIASPHATADAGNGLFSFYCINSIENNDTNATNFTFDVSKIFATADPTSSPGNTSFSNKVQTAPATQLVAAHTTSPTMGRIVINVQGVDPKTKTPKLDLGYHSGNGESVVLVRDGGTNAPAVSFLDPASPIHPNNLPACP